MNDLLDDTPMYRIFNLFDLVNTISTEKIRLSQASRMQDANELFGLYFDLLRSNFGPWNVDDINKVQQSFREAQSHHYITCWTRVPDNIAVWSLYSPAKDAIQAHTTFGSIRRALYSHFEAFPYARAYELEPNDPMDLFLPPNIGPVSYIDFRNEFGRLKQQCIEYFNERDHWFKAQINRKKNNNAQIQQTDLRNISMGWIEKEDEIRNRIFQAPRSGGALLKDHRYAHEKEVRFVLSLRRRDGRSKEECEAHPMAGLDDPSRHPEAKLCPPNVFVPFSRSEFSGFQVDGRMEGYKLEAINSILSEFGFTASRNDAFSPIEI